MKHSKQSNNKQSSFFSFDAIGTHWEIESDKHIDEQSVLTRIDAYDKNYSRFRSDSLVTTIAQKSGSYTLPDDARTLFDIYKKLYDLTNGLFTPLIGQALSDTGYDADYSLQTKVLISNPPKWDDVMDYNFPLLHVTQPLLLDVGAGGKGYLTDIIGQMLYDAGVRTYTINAGGDVVYYAWDHQPLMVALEDPSNTDEGIGIARVENGSICGSAGNRRVWSDYHHIINPNTLTSPRGIEATWVVARSGLIADALSTALFLVTPNILVEHFDFSYVILHNDRSITYSENFNGEFFA